MKDKKYTSIRLEVTSGCNLKCKYCHNSEYINRKDDMTTDEILTLVSETKKVYDINKILLTGGEPLVNKDIILIIKHISELGIKADMVTNATLLTKSLAKELEEAGLKRIRISIDTVTDENSLRDGTITENLWKKAEWIAKNTGIEVCIHTVCNPSNADKLFDVYQKVCAIGASRWRVFDIGFQGGALKNIDFEGYYEKMMDSCVKILNHYIENHLEDKLDIEINNIFRTIMLKAKPSNVDCMEMLDKRLKYSPCDYVADHQISVRSDGTATLCQYFHNTIFDFKGNNFDIKKTLENKHLNPEYVILMKDLSYCSKCKYCLVCNSGCRARANFLTGDITEADPGACFICRKVNEDIIPILPRNTREAYMECINPNGLEPKYNIDDLRQIMKEKGLTDDRI